MAEVQFWFGSAADDRIIGMEFLALMIGALLVVWLIDGAISMIGRKR